MEYDGASEAARRVGALSIHLYPSSSFLCSLSTQKLLSLELGGEIFNKTSSYLCLTQTGASLRVRATRTLPPPPHADRSITRSPTSGSERIAAG